MDADNTCTATFIVLVSGVIVLLKSHQRLRPLVAFFRGDPTLP